jgi:helix-turn-helix protein
MYSHIATTLVISAFSIVALSYTVKSITELYKKPVDRFTYLVNGCYVVFQAFTSPQGYVVYDVFFEGKFMRTTRPRFQVELTSSFEEAFRQRLVHMLIKHRNKKVTFSRFKLVQESIIDVNGSIVSSGKPYSLYTKVSVLNRV